jgi:predicted peptidase
MYRICASMLLSLVVFTGCSKSTVVATGQHSGSFTKTVCKDIRMNYQLYLPKDYGKADKQWPLILFLHGAGERGDNIEKVKAHGPAKLAAEGKDFNFIIVSPQCPQENWWPSLTDDLMLLVKDISQKYQVDTKRLYVTGLSMGGYGTWSMIVKYPETFAAAAPICGGGDAVLAKFRLGKMPIWAFHGAKDNVVPPNKSEEMVNAAKAAGNTNIQFTVYPEAGHDSWTETYNNPELYTWFLSHHR